MNIPAPALTALKASIANVAHAWTMTGVMEHAHTEIVELVPVEVVSKSFQLRSVPLGLILVMMATVTDDALTVLRIIYNGTSFDTTDAPLFSTLQTMATASSTAAAAELLDKLT